MRCLALAFAMVTAASCQWTMQPSHTTAGLRGVHNVGNGVVWASGTEGTVLHTVDDGATWQTCAVPPGAEKLDFRGIQAFSAGTAIVMSSGTGDLSRLYKTTDACKTWRLAFTNPDPSGFWDAIKFTSPRNGMVMGDPVNDRFPMFFTTDGGDTWREFDSTPAFAGNHESMFAASNSALLLDEKKSKFYFLTGGESNSFIAADLHFGAGAICGDCRNVVRAHPVFAFGEAAGGFSLAARPHGSDPVIVAVGGDYKFPDRTSGTASFRVANNRWFAATTPPHGYRSAVAYSASAKTWIAVGPNGTDISTDDGRNWHPLKPMARDAADADKNWNALSLPFVVGPQGRIGKLSPTALAGSPN